MSFKRKITQKIEELEVSLEGQQMPRVVEILIAMEAEISALKKESKK